MNNNYAAQFNEEVKTIVTCELCLKKIRIPRRKKKICVTCPRCRHKFFYQYYGLGFSLLHKKPLLIGLIGGLAGILVTELIITSQFLSKVNPLVYTIVVIGTFSICLGMFLESAEGFLKKHQDSLPYGLKVGAIIGLISGVISGLFAQLVFSGILLYILLDPYTFLWSATSNLDSSLIPMMFARTIGWGVLGFLIGLLFSIKEKSFEDVKSGMILGTIGGAIGGFLFDPLTSVFQIGEGTLGRLFGFSVLGMAIGIAVFRFRMVVNRGKPPVFTKLPKADEVIVKEEGSLAAPALAISGMVLFIVGMFLVVGNLAGVFPTFPFAGFITSSIGIAMLTAAVQM